MSEEEVRFHGARIRYRSHYNAPSGMRRPAWVNMRCVVGDEASFGATCGWGSSAVSRSRPRVEEEMLRLSTRKPLCIRLTLTVFSGNLGSGSGFGAAAADATTGALTGAGAGPAPPVALATPLAGAAAGAAAGGAAEPAVAGAITTSPNSKASLSSSRTFAAAAGAGAAGAAAGRGAELDAAAKSTATGLGSGEGFAAPALAFFVMRSSLSAPSAKRISPFTSDLPASNAGITASENSSVGEMVHRS